MVENIVILKEPSFNVDSMNTFLRKLVGAMKNDISSIGRM
jgi:hypothetical protein